MNIHNLKDRHIGLTSADKEQMLQCLGVPSLEALLDEVIPQNIRLKANDSCSFEQPIAEYAFLEKISDCFKQLDPVRYLIGQGYYGTCTPAVILRNVFQNPSWYTSYTPYQAEISQGRLEALFVFQTMVSELTNLPLANCSLLDEATAVAEAVTMMHRLRSKEQVKNNVCKVFVDNAVFEATKEVLKTRTSGQNITLVFGDYTTFKPSEEYFGAVVQFPNADGVVEDYSYFIDQCHANGLLVTAIEDLLALALLKPLNADIACGSAQRFGVPMAYGGLSLGDMATRAEYKREIPGRIIGLSKDRCGRDAYRMALQMREQHIKREKATSNICTSAALCAIMAGLYGVYHGAEGIRQIAEEIHSKAVYLNEALQAYGYTQVNSVFFDTLKIVNLNKDQVKQLQQSANEEKVAFFVDKENNILISIDETTTTEDMQHVINVFASLHGDMPSQVSDHDLQNLWAIDPENVRTVDYLQQNIFKIYHTETEMLRYIKRLERKDISLTHSMIPLGSCTMKLNPSATMIPTYSTDLFRIHPLASGNEALKAVIDEIKEALNYLTGMNACCLQPTSGAAGEYAGLVTIRAYLLAQQNDQQPLKRVHILIPASAHGTNPASCVQAGFIPVVIACDEKGNTDLNEWQAKAEEYQQTLAGCMITYPSTHGIFEEDIKKMCQIVHTYGGEVYLDGANMNALVGYTHPRAIGADVCHLNLHKTFATPHGGGGPGAGAICCADHLKEFMPTATANRVSSTENGNLGMALVAYGYICMMGLEGLKEATATAILNANYMAEKLKDAYGVVYRGAKGRVGHELILDCRQFHAMGVTEADIAKRLMDYGYHAPTLSFPVHGTLMIEPTESESKKEMDNFIDALLTIRQEIEEIATGKADSKDNVLVNAPHAEYEIMEETWSHSYSRQKAYYPIESVANNKFWVPVCRADNGWGDRNLISKLEK